MFPFDPDSSARSPVYIEQSAPTIGVFRSLTGSHCRPEYVLHEPFSHFATPGPAGYDDGRIRRRSRMIGYAIAARRHRFPDEIPCVYRPFAESGEGLPLDG